MCADVDEFKPLMLDLGFVQKDHRPGVLVRTIGDTDLLVLLSHKHTTFAVNPDPNDPIGFKYNFKQNYDMARKAITNYVDILTTLNKCQESNP